MKYLLELLWLFLPREEGEGEGEGGEGEGEGGEGEGEGGEGEGQRKPLGGDDPDAKPDWCQDKFWNPDTKAPRTEVAPKAYNELEGKLRTNKDELKEEIRAEMVASAPESYEVSLSEDLKIPENIELDLTSEDPIVKWFFEKAKTKGMSQDEVSEWLNDYIKIELEAMPDVSAEIEKLGDHGQDRMLRVHNWLETKLSDEQFKAINPLLSSAAQVAALEVLMKSSGPSDFEGDTGGPALTLEELRTMQNDKRAWQDKDPVFLKKIQDGYKRLYGNK